MTDIENAIKTKLELLTYLYIPLKSLKNDIAIQFKFNEDDKQYFYYINCGKKKAILKEGNNSQSFIIINTSLANWEKLTGMYENPIILLLTGKIKIEKNLLFFILNFQKMFNGIKNYPIKEKIFYSSRKNINIKQVLLINCSPRKNGAGSIFLERIKKGISAAKVKFQQLNVSELKINPCISCLKCFTKDKYYCIPFRNDDMKKVIDLYVKSDLVIWSTPIYFHFGSSYLKILMDRLCSMISSSMVITKMGYPTHPMKHYPQPLHFLFTYGGLRDTDTYKGVYYSMKSFTNHGFSELIGSLFRCESMAFLVQDIYTKKMHDVLNKLEEISKKVVTNKKVSWFDKIAFTRKLIPINLYMTAANTLKHIFFH